MENQIRAKHAASVLNSTMVEVESQGLPPPQNLRRSKQRKANEQNAPKFNQQLTAVKKRSLAMISRLAYNDPNVKSVEENQHGISFGKGDTVPTKKAEP